MLLASVKFLVAPPVALFGLKVGVWETSIGMFFGGLLGVFTFYYTGSFFIKRGLKKRLENNKRAVEAGTELPKVFTRRNKQIVQIKRKLGVYGVVFIALPFVSLPVEGILCAKFFRHDRRLIPLLVISVAIWSVILSFFFSIFELNIS